MNTKSFNDSSFSIVIILNICTDFTPGCFFDLNAFKLIKQDHKSSLLLRLNLLTCVAYSEIDSLNNYLSI